MIVSTDHNYNGLQRRVKQRGIEQISPLRRNRTWPSTQDGQSTWRSRDRCIARRTIAQFSVFWLLDLRHQRNLTLYQADCAPREC